MLQPVKSIRPFVGTPDYEKSLRFYQAWGWQALSLPPKLTYLQLGDFGFYLQDAYVKDWVDNTMLFLEVKDLPIYRDHLVQLKLTDQFPDSRLDPLIREFDWGREFFLHDPAGVLWHIGEFQ